MKYAVVALMLLASTAGAADLPRVYIEASETVDAGNSKDKAKQIDFGSAMRRRSEEKCSRCGGHRREVPSGRSRPSHLRRRLPQEPKWPSSSCGAAVASLSSR